MKYLLLLIAAVGVLAIAGRSAAVTPENHTVCVMEPMLWHPNATDASVVFDDLDWGMGLIWDWVLNDSGIDIDSLESWLGWDFGIWLYSCEHNYGTTYESIMVSTYASESARNTVLASHSGYEPYDGSDFYGIVMPNEKIDDYYSSANSIVYLDICYGLSVIDGGFDGYGVGLGYSGYVFSNVAALDIVNFWWALIDQSTGGRTVSQAMIASGATLEYGTSSQVSMSLYPLDPVLAVSGNISWSLDGGNVVLSVFTNVQPEDGLELVRQDINGHVEMVWGMQDFEMIQHTGNGSYTFFDQAPGLGPRYYVLRLRYGEGLLDLDKVLVPGVVSEALEFEAFPNPFNPSIHLRIVLPADMELAVGIYDSRGRFVKTLREWAESDRQVDIKWDGQDASGQRVASGVYFVRLRTEAHDYFKKVMMLK